MSKTSLKLSKKCNLSNYSEDHKYESFDLSIETEVEGVVTDAIVTETFQRLRQTLLEQEHDTLVFFLENEHSEEETKKELDEISLD